MSFMKNRQMRRAMRAAEAERERELAEIGVPVAELRMTICVIDPRVLEAEADMASSARRIKKLVVDAHNAFSTAIENEFKYDHIEGLEFGLHVAIGGYMIDQDE